MVLKHTHSSLQKHRCHELHLVGGTIPIQKRLNHGGRWGLQTVHLGCSAANRASTFKVPRMTLSMQCRLQGQGLPRPYAHTMSAYRQQQDVMALLSISWSASRGHGQRLPLNHVCLEERCRNLLLFESRGFLSPLSS